MLKPIAIATAVAGTLDIVFAMILTIVLLGMVGVALLSMTLLLAREGRRTRQEAQAEAEAEALAARLAHRDEGPALEGAGRDVEADIPAL